jgi:hypothetical protein
MWPRTYSLTHPAKSLLHKYSTIGCPVDCGKDWSIDHIHNSILHGPHKSAQSKEAIQSIHDETLLKIKQGFAKIIKFKDIKRDMPKNLKISPVACIPHKSKSFRVILDLSFNLKIGKKIYPSVNENTIKLAPPEAMVQLGNCIRRMISTLESNYNMDQPYKFCKLDIKDGFWRLVVHEADAWKFCYVLPSINKKITNIDEAQLVVPKSLQMGWCESPPFFCASSETARDTIAHLIQTKESLPAHKFEQKMLPNEYPNTENSTEDSTLIEVFVDDFIGMTNKLDKNHLLQISRAMLHGVHSVFPPNEITQHPGGDSIAEKKMDKGEGKWEYQKEVLGWLFDGQKFTIQLPPEKCVNIVNLIKEIIKKPAISLKKFQRIAGKLQHASMGIPGGSGLFSPLQQAMAGDPKYIKIDKYIKTALQDWRTIIHYLKHNPTSVKQLVADIPDIVQYSDACKLGAGGVITPGLQPFPHTVWQIQWPQYIQERLVTDDNPKGDISMNDLELAGIVLNFLALETMQPDLQNTHIGAYCDNTSAVSWATKLRTSKSIPAARLLRMLGLRILASKTSSLTTLNIPGEENKMADLSSRAFKHGESFNTISSLSSFFNKTFPLPQSLSWREHKIPQKLISRVISCVRGEQLTMESLLRLPKQGKNTGTTGKPTWASGTKTVSSKITPNLSEASSSQHLLRGCGQASTAEELKSKFQRSRKRWRPSQRPQNWQENRAPFINTRTRTSSRSKDA